MWRGLSMLAAAEAGLNVKQRLRAYVLYAAAAILGLVGAVFALIALQIWLTRYMSGASAGLLIAVALVLAALALYVAGRSVLTRRSTRFPVNTTAMAMAPVALKAISRKISLRTVAVVAVVVLGAVVGRQLSRDEE